MPLEKCLNEFFRTSKIDLEGVTKTDITRYRIVPKGRTARQDCISGYLKIEPRIADVLYWTRTAQEDVVTRWYQDTALMYAMCATRFIPERTHCVPGCDVFHSSLTNYFLSYQVTEPEDFTLVVKLVSAVGFCGERYNPFGNIGARDVYSVISMHHSWMEGWDANGPCPEAGPRSFRSIALFSARSMCAWKKKLPKQLLEAEVVVTSSIIQIAHRMSQERSEDMNSVLSDRNTLEQLAVAAIETFKSNNPMKAAEVGFGGNPMIDLAKLACFVATAKWIETSDQSTELSSIEEEDSWGGDDRTPIQEVSFVESLASIYSRASEVTVKLQASSQIANSTHGRELCAAVAGEMKRRRHMMGEETSGSEAGSLP
jgi:hypothetical protein